MAGKGAIVIPTGFITAKSGIEKRILKKIVDEHWVYGCVSMPSNVFATTGTNVSVLFYLHVGICDFPRGGFFIFHVGVNHFLRSFI